MGMPKPGPCGLMNLFCICMAWAWPGGLMPGWGEPCLWTGDMCPVMAAGDMWPGPGDIECTGDMEGDWVLGGRPIEFGLKGFSSWILGDMCGCGD